MTSIVSHSGGCPRIGKGHTDEAKRASDIAVMHWLANGMDAVNGWMAFRLIDGQSDMALYPSKSVAIAYQKGDEFLYMYLPLHPGGMNVCEAEVMLSVHRRAYQNGFRLVDPDKKNGGVNIIPRIGAAEVAQQIRALN